MANYNKKGFKEISPDKLKDANFLFTLGLIRNDIADLLYLEKLHSNRYNRAIAETYTAEGGRVSGRNVFFLRMALSVIFETFNFLEQKRNKIESDGVLSRALEKIDISKRNLWNILFAIATNDDSFLENKTIKPEIKKLKLLADKTRHNLTFHYYHSNKYLKVGFDKAFFNSEKGYHNIFACVSEESKIKSRNRSYYVDLAAQVYMEEEYGGGIRLPLITNETVSKFLTPIHSLFTDILSKYHKDLVE